MLSEVRSVNELKSSESMGLQRSPPPVPLTTPLRLPFVTDILIVDIFATTLPETLTVELVLQLLLVLLFKFETLELLPTRGTRIGGNAEIKKKEKRNYNTFLINKI